MHLRIRTIIGAAAAIGLMAALPAQADGGNGITVPLHRSTLITLPTPMSEVMVADPNIADVHAHNSTHLTVVGKQLGRTNLRIFDKDSKLLREMDITVGYDLPAVRQALKNFLPNEVIAVDMVNTSVALTGNVSNAAVADKAVKIVKDFVQVHKGGIDAPTPVDKNTQLDLKMPLDQTPEILNMLQITSGQQVMLRVRVGEINRTALKDLGVDLNAALAGGNLQFGTGAGLAGLLIPATVSNTNSSSFHYGPGSFLFPSDSNNMPINTQGAAIGRLTHGNDILSSALHALEQDGLFKLLAEPNLVAVSGEEANFLAGGEIPIPVPQSSGNSNNTITIEYKPYGVAVKFKPMVLTDSRIRMEVQPEVSELDQANAVNVSGFLVPALTTRRAKTTVELAPGESFMIAGLISDQSKATINQLPGLKELPVLGALFRSTEFQRNETELVIAVTPYVVDPMKSSDVKLPTDRFRPASQMEMFFYGALGSTSGNAQTISQTPSMLEGPIGFMTD